MIGLINAYQFDPKEPYHREYRDMFQTFFEEILLYQPIKRFDVALGETLPDLNSCDGYILSGSPKAAYEKDPWIIELGDFIRKAHTLKKKIVGICFGHQLIAHSLGGLAEKSPSGWGVGVHKFQILEHREWMKPKLTTPKQTMALLFSHQDQVTRLPEDSTLLAGNKFCPYQMFTIGNHILGMQGHPEFNVKFAKGRLTARFERIGAEKVKQAMQTLEEETHGQILGQWIRHFLLL